MEITGRVVAVSRDPLTAPGVPTEQSDRDRAIDLARHVVRNPDRGVLLPSQQDLLAREFLKVLGLPG